MNEIRIFIIHLSNPKTMYPTLMLVILNILLFTPFYPSADWNSDWIYMASEVSVLLSATPQTNMSYLIFLHATHFQSPSPKAHINSIGNVTAHLSDPENYRLENNISNFNYFYAWIYQSLPNFIFLPTCLGRGGGLYLHLNGIGSISIHFSNFESNEFHINMHCFSLLSHVILFQCPPMVSYTTVVFSGF